MKIGTHVSAAGGVGKAIDRAVDIGAESIQIFASSPRSWAFKPLNEQDIAAFREKSEFHGVGPAFIHGSYLVNLGGPPDLLRKSIHSLMSNMDAAGRLGARAVIFHLGSHKGRGTDAVFSQVVEALDVIVRGSPPDVWLTIENSAGAGGHIGSTFEEIGRIVDAVRSQRVRVCIDTQHCFAAGYDVRDERGVREVMSEFDRAIGRERLGAVHANDSKSALGSGVDRHENIGEGSIGIGGFEAIIAHPAFSDAPLLLEVPGRDRKGPDEENVNRLKDIRSRLGAA